MIRQGLPGALLLAALLAVPAASAGDKFYRYRNQSGQTVIDFTVPPEFADKGYEVLSPGGRVIERVPPRQEVEDAASPEEVAARQREDEFLLRSYSTTAEIERTRDRRLQLVRQEIQILENNIEEYRQRRETFLQRAANYQRSGQETPEVIKRVLEDLDAQEARAEKALAERQQEHDAIVERHERYARRLVELRGPEADSSLSEEEKKAAAPGASSRRASKED